ncbi:MAG: flagellar biosynthetic protein FliO [Pseudolabrys sp.]|jgi:flagellar protein FliO/FliZ
MDALFGTSMPLAARFFIAFLVVLALIGLTAWLVRRFGANRLGGTARGRQPRLAVIDAASVDGRRRLVLVRRDNVEHLLMIGGPSDVVIEPNIVRAAAAGVREPARLAPEPAARAAAPPVEGGWPPPPPVSQPMRPSPPRVHRAPAAEESAPPPAARARHSDSLSGLAAELSSKLAAPGEHASQPREREREVPRTAAAPSVAPATPTPSETQAAAAPNPDRNLADMAQQLEAALRRAPAAENRPPVTDALAAPQAPRAPTHEAKPRVEPKFEAPKHEPPAHEPPKFEVARHEPRIEAPKPEATKPEPHQAEPPKFEAPKPPEPHKAEGRHGPAFERAASEPKFEHKPEPKLESRPEPKPPEAPTAPEKKLYDNLEEEMANLLGRPPEKS